MKVLFYINAIHHGGAERVITLLAKQFSRKGVDSVLVTSFYDEWEYPVDGKVKRLSLYANKLSGNFIVRNYKLISRLRNVIIEEKPDAIISFMAEPNFRSLIANIGLKSKIIISIRNDPVKEYPNFLFKVLARNLYRYADGIVFQTIDAQRWFSDKIANKSTVIKNPVDPLFYMATNDGETNGIVTTGRLTPQKNHLLLIKAFAQIAEKVEDNLYIYGEGELREELVSFAQSLDLANRVFIPGAVKDVANVLAKAKLFVLSSDYEGMPNSLMEAMAIGIPCVSTDCPSGGPKELFGPEGQEYLVEVGNVSELAETILESIKTRENRNKNANIMKNRAKLFTTDKVIYEWYNYVEKVLDRK